MTPQRLNKYLATNFGISRREADILIQKGAVKINGKNAEIGQRVNEGDKVTLDGKEIVQQKLIYIALNKPAGYVCSRKRQGNAPTMYELLPKELQNLKSVGRLDKDSSGLILLTNDGDFAFQMTHPKFYKTKKYTVTLDRALNWDVTLHEGRNRQIRRTFDALGYKVVTLHRYQFDNYKISNLKPGKWEEVKKI